MELELSIEDLLNKRRVESDRIEFKASWNPDDIYHSICAFANDFDNVGGGYVLIGVEEKNGVAVRPVKGLEEYELDTIQKELLGYNNTMIPAYFPRVIIEQVDGKNVVVLWVTPECKDRIRHQSMLLLRRIKSIITIYGMRQARFVQMRSRNEN